MRLVWFALLQVIDALTTLLFLRHGVGEANPLIRTALAISGNPALALAVPKVFAMALGLYAWRSGRRELLRRMNFVFAIVAAWNLVAVAVSGVTR